MSEKLSSDKRRNSFYHFLVSEKYITEAELIDSILIQQARLPNLLEIVRSKGWLNSTEILKIINQQNETEVDFRSAACSLKLWKNEWDTQIQSHHSTLTQILLERKIIKPEILTLALDNFLKYDQEFATERKLIDTSRIRNIAAVVRNTGVISPTQNLELLDGIEGLIKEIASLKLGNTEEIDPMLEQIQFYRTYSLKPGPERLKQWLKFILNAAQTNPSAFKAIDKL